MSLIKAILIELNCYSDGEHSVLLSKQAAHFLLISLSILRKLLSSNMCAGNVQYHSNFTKLSSDLIKKKQVAFNLIISERPSA